MGLSIIQYVIFIAVIILVFATDMLVGKRNRDRHANKDGAKDKKVIQEDTCVSGYCIDHTYNKLELPATKPSHVRINLEVSQGPLKIRTPHSQIRYRFISMSNS